MIRLTREERDAIHEDILQSAHGDFAGLWEIPWWLTRLAPDATADEVRTTTLAMVREFLERGELRAGFPDSSGLKFRPWSLSTDEVMAFIEREWDRLGGAPDIGGIVWFDLTDRENWRPK